MLHFCRKEGDGNFAAAHSLPYLPLSFHGSSMAHNITVKFQAFPPQNSVALTQAMCGGLTVELKVTLAHLKLCGRKFLDLESGLWSKVAHSMLSLCICSPGKELILNDG
jgi:E3 ubiquitin-protein ligase HUWE1